VSVFFENIYIKIEFSTKQRFDSKHIEFRLPNKKT